MARTRMMRWIVRLEKDHLEANRRGVPAEWIHQERQSGVSRREFLTRAAAGAAGVAIFGTGVAACGGTSSTARIGIIGAGIAGLNAALTLQRAGYASTVFEAADRLGGRMHSNTTGYWRDGQISEWCGELIDSEHHTILQLAREFRIPVIDELQNLPRNSEDIYYAHGRYYPYAQATRDFQPVFAAIQAQTRRAPFPTTYRNNTPAGKALDDMSVYRWIERYVPGGHRSNLGAILDSAYVSEYGLDTREQSSLNLVYLLSYQPSTGDFAIYGDSDEQYGIQGGTQRLPLAIADRIRTATPRCGIRTGWRMTAIAANSKNGVTCTFSTPNGTVTETFDRVILTIPFSVLRGLDYRHAGFDRLKQTAISQLGYGTNTKLNLQFDSRYWNVTGSWPVVSDGTAYADLPFATAWDTSGRQGRSGLLALFPGGGYGTSVKTTSPYTTTSDPRTAAYARRYLRQIETIWPGISKHYLELGTISTPWSDPNLLGSYSCWKVGQYTAFSGYEGVRQGRIHFAGEHCSVNYQGFMEGGAQEGRRAANEILHDYKKGIIP